VYNVFMCVPDIVIRYLMRRADDDVVVSRAKIGSRTDEDEEATEGNLGADMEVPPCPLFSCLPSRSIVRIPCR
jgi:hypothetical protein